MKPGQYERFEHLRFDDFRRLASDETLSPHEKIGFPDEYRAGKEADILADLTAKAPALLRQNQIVFDIGAGCGVLAHRLIATCRDRGHELVLLDSEEMLAQLPDGPGIVKAPGYYPGDHGAVLSEYAGRVDAVLAYSVLHYVFVEGNVFEFVDASLPLLAPGGRMLIGDIPNVSKRKRFFASAQGVRHHQAFTDTSTMPPVVFNTVEGDRIDDAVVLALVARSRAAGYDAYVLPQADPLPMANRREDILVCRP